MSNQKWTLLLAALALVSLVATGCGSDDSSPAAPTLDTAPPVLPSGVDVAYVSTQHQAVLSWDANTVDADFAGFLVTRTAYNGTVELFATPQAQTSLVDDIAGLGRSLTYHIYAVDTSGNVSAATNAALTITIDEQAPSPSNP